ncbi:phosphoenolpyruvate-utilizing N-terminal domain-containing protein [Staphylococcus aureus]
MKNENANAATALTDVTTQFVTIFESMDNEYMKNVRLIFATFLNVCYHIF